MIWIKIAQMFAALGTFVARTLPGAVLFFWSQIAAGTAATSLANNWIF